MNRKNTELVLFQLKNNLFPRDRFQSTGGEQVLLSADAGWNVCYIFPMISDPGTGLPSRWLSIPGAAGCTAQSCGFRDRFSDLKRAGVLLYGISSQPLADLEKARARLRLPFHLLSDEQLLLKDNPGLPTFKTDEREFYKRITLVAKGGIVRKIFYPVHSPAGNVHDVLNWLQTNMEETI